MAPATVSTRPDNACCGAPCVRWAPFCRLLYVVEYARAGFLHGAGDLGLRVVARLKANRPELFAAAQRRFRGQTPTAVFHEGGDQVEVWDADDFDPWEPSAGQPYAFSSIGNTNPMARWSKLYW